MTRPSRATASGRAYLDLQARARKEGRPADELLTLYVLERFLYRLSVSAYRDRLILKGGMLLSAFGQRRPTRDIDLLAETTSNEPEVIAALVREIAAVEADDGVVYETGQTSTRMIREQDLYAAVRVAVPARIDRARQPLRIDVNVGDPVTPAPTIVSYPALLGQPFPLLAYPIEAVLAEKLVTMVARGDTTTRDRDFADVLLLAGHHDISAVTLSRAVSATAGFRQVALRAISSTLVTLGRDRQHDWQRLLARGAGRQAAIRLFPGNPASHGLRRSSHHRLCDIRPLGPSARSVDGLALPSRRSSTATKVSLCRMMARPLSASFQQPMHSPTMQTNWHVESSLSVAAGQAIVPVAWNASWSESHENCVRLVLSEHKSAESVQAERSARRSGPLLIRGFGVQVPGGAPGGRKTVHGWLAPKWELYNCGRPG